MKNIWIVTDSKESLAYLTAAAKALGGETTVVFIGETSEVRGAKKAHILCGKSSVLEYMPTISSILEESGADLVLCDTSSNGRLMAGILAAKMNAAILSDLSALEMDGTLMATRLVYGGAAYKIEKVLCDKAVLCIGQGMYECEEMAEIAELVSADIFDSGVTFIEKSVKEGKTVNLAAAKKIVAVGRGISTEELYDKTVEFSSLIEAEMGCTRPIADELKFMPKDTYIGVSGVMLKPSFYLGIGVSGQVQHMIGASTATTILAINKDKNAPIFKQCDYGLVADVNEVLPLLMEKLR